MAYDSQRLMIGSNEKAMEVNYIVRRVLMRKDFLIALSMCFTLLIGFFMTNTSAQQIDVHNIKMVTVKNGDTLWDIASANSDNTVDVREVVHAIKDMNGLSESVVLQPGSQLKVPTIQTHSQNNGYMARND